MLPEPSHPRWRELVAGKTRFELENLAAKMLVTRLRLRTSRGEEAAITEAVGVAWEFFARNEATTTTDVRAIFGGQP